MRKPKRRSFSFRYTFAEYTGKRCARRRGIREKHKVSRSNPSVLGADSLCPMGPMLEGLIMGLVMQD